VCFVVYGLMTFVC